MKSTRCYICSLFGSMYKLFVKPILFLFTPERAHYFVFSFLKILFWVPGLRAVCSLFFHVNKKGLEKEVFGIRFPNPVGLAAGFDKDAKGFSQLFSFGFGFIEIGTVTPKPQEGNPKPRLFRLPLDNALINRMGFNNNGVDNAVKRLRKRNRGLIVGGNIGKNKITPNEAAVKDYTYSFLALHEVVDYFVVNVSSPNTPNLRELQEKEPLKELLNKLNELNGTFTKQKPILLKIAPDLTDSQLDDIVEIAIETNLAGIIATNTTISREGLKTPSKIVESKGNGGLSGRPLTNRSTEVIKYLSKKSGKKFSIIGVGGIHSPKDAQEKLEAGADLIQLYTGFIYEGPGLVKKILKSL